jgi:hypothetical protein
LVKVRGWQRPIVSFIYHIISIGVLILIWFWIAAVILVPASILFAYVIKILEPWRLGLAGPWLVLSNLIPILYSFFFVSVFIFISWQITRFMIKGSDFIWGKIPIAIKGKPI